MANEQKLDINGWRLVLKILVAVLSAVLATMKEDDK